MTIDDENSIYVGGLPYSSTEHSLRRVFEPYGSIVAVKIVNDRSTRGKCFGFVTFRNPRSVIDAINDMDGKAIDGRVVKVNGVTTRGGRSNFSREHFRHNADRGMDWDRGRDHERDYDRDKDRFRERYGNRSRERERSWDYDEHKEIGYGHARDHDLASDSFLDGDKVKDSDLIYNEQKQVRISDRNLERDHNLDGDGYGEVNGIIGDNNLAEKDTEQHSRKQNVSTDNERRNRGFSSDSSGYNDEVKGKLQTTIRMHDALEKEISQMEETLEDKQLFVSDLQKKVKKLEDALITAKKASSQRKVQWSKLCNCFLQVKDYTERLKSSEQELQSLVDSAAMEIHVGDEVGRRDGLFANGSA